MRDNLRPTDRYLKQLLQEDYNQESKHYVLRLPCEHGSIELDKPQDVYVQCNICFKKFHLLWSAVNKQVKEVI